MKYSVVSNDVPSGECRVRLPVMVDMGEIDVPRSLDQVSSMFDSYAVLAIIKVILFAQDFEMHH